MPERDDRGRVLVAIAREAIGERLGACQARERTEAWLAEPAATFVTLRTGKDLRGCIGSLDPRRPLGLDVASNARAAAFSDPRFAPLAASEFVAIRIEVSVLSPRTPIEAADESDAAARLRPGVDGVYLECEGRAATFLPQVWESLPEPGQFLGQLKAKAGLAPDHWSEDFRAWRFGADVVSSDALADPAALWT